MEELQVIRDVYKQLVQQTCISSLRQILIQDHASLLCIIELRFSKKPIQEQVRMSYWTREGCAQQLTSA